MTEQYSPRRSCLYMPCSNERALVKAMSLPADALIFDLEDAVAPDAKASARQAIVNALSANDYGYREKLVRVNPVDTDWGMEDLKALKNTDIDGLVLPKVETCEEINQALAIIGEDKPVWIMMETPKGILNAEQLAAHDSVNVLVMGTNDLAREMRVAQSGSRNEFSYAFGRCIMAARAHDCDILDGVYNQLDNPQGFEAVCQHGKQLGFDGKTLIHPGQIDIANTVFGPSPEALEEAQAIINAWQSSQEKGVLVVNGRLVESLHVAESERLLAIAASIEAR